MAKARGKPRAFCFAWAVVAGIKKRAGKPARGWGKREVSVAPERLVSLDQGGVFVDADVAQHVRRQGRQVFSGALSQFPGRHGQRNRNQHAGKRWQRAGRKREGFLKRHDVT